MLDNVEEVDGQDNLENGNAVGAWMEDSWGFNESIFDFLVAGNDARDDFDGQDGGSWTYKYHANNVLTLNTHFIHLLAHMTGMVKRIEHLAGLWDGDGLVGIQAG